MSRITDLTRDVESLIDRYSMDEVFATLQFIKGFPLSRLVVITDGAGMGVNVTVEQFNELAALYLSGQKIGTIRRLRELHYGLGLREAKDMVERTDWAKRPF